VPPHPRGTTRSPTRYDWVSRAIIVSIHCTCSFQFTPGKWTWVRPSEFERSCDLRASIERWCSVGLTKRGGRGGDRDRMASLARLVAPGPPASVASGCELGGVRRAICARDRLDPAEVPHGLGVDLGLADSEGPEHIPAADRELLAHGAGSRSRSTQQQGPQEEEQR
jgi:hypothetical protein